MASSSTPSTPRSTRLWWRSKSFRTLPCTLQRTPWAPSSGRAPAARPPRPGTAAYGGDPQPPVNPLLGVERPRQRRHARCHGLQRRVPPAVRQEPTDSPVVQDVHLRRPFRHREPGASGPLDEPFRQAAYYWAAAAVLAQRSWSLGSRTTQRNLCPLASSPAASSAVCSVDSVPPLPKHTYRTDLSGCSSSHRRQLCLCSADEHVPRGRGRAR
ncbi:hypothetical protein U9M48_018402 [Paspalum notatum var. saurae]|uniref:Uncharacterized protein n=1 Tax=Paspalum notatum var. saurae TaxID=547442 RepID=A0AAQ3WPN4_PASNO